MSETTRAHTPGPWTWLNYPDGRKLLVAANRAVIHCPDAAIACEPADQHLLAAAPDLLAALKHLMRYDIGDTDGAKEARAAIAKAEGLS